MLIRSLTLTLLLAIAGPLFAADNDSPIAGDMGRARPLIVIAQSTIDPVWVGLKKSLEDPANKKGVADRNIKVYTILNMAGQLDGKDSTPGSDDGMDAACFWYEPATRELRFAGANYAVVGGSAADNANLNGAGGAGDHAIAHG